MRHFLLACLLIACVSLAGAQVRPTFIKRTFPSRSSNSSVAGITADLNGDTVPDLVLCCDTSGNAWYQLASGTGQFSAPVTIGAAAGFATLLASGDFNQDGKQDILLVDASRSITIYYNQGAGVFSPTTYFPNANALNVTVADFNHDGNLDIAYVPNAVSPVQVFVSLGDGKGGFSSPAPVYTVSSDTLAFNLVPGDFDGDGNADLAFNITPCFRGGCNPATIYALYGDGSGQFAAKAFPQETELNMVAADVNGDGITDLAVTTFCSVTVCPESIGALFGRPNRSFVEALTPTPGADINFLAVADLNGDGRKDLVDTYGSLETLGAYLALATTSNSWKAQVKIPLSNQGGTSQLPFAVDFNRDQKADVVIYQSETGVLQELLNTTQGTMSATLPSVP
jgi:hypothetical protein